MPHSWSEISGGALVQGRDCAVRESLHLQVKGESLYETRTTKRGSAGQQSSDNEESSWFVQEDWMAVPEVEFESAEIPTVEVKGES